MRKLIFVFSLTSLFLLSACGSTAPNPNIPCPDSMAGYVAGQATAGFVRSCLGAPYNESHGGPGGMFNYMYQSKDGKMIFFVFDKSGLLSHVRGYETKQP